VVSLSPGPVLGEFQATAGTRVSARTPGALEPEAVVAAALSRLESGGGTVTPGLANRLIATAARVAPRRLAIRAAVAVYRRLR
jgi:short-subunit dehydrogenase